MNVFVVAVRGRRDVTENCIRSFSHTLGAGFQPSFMVVMDGAEEADAISYAQACAWVNRKMAVVYTRWVGCSLGQSWNYAINSIQGVCSSAELAGPVNVHLMQNDAIFFKEGWLAELENALDTPGVGAVGTSQGVTPSGWPFVTGVFQSFRLAAALAIAEKGRVIDERFNFSHTDADVCIRLEKAGYPSLHLPGLEHAENAYMLHLVSQTSFALHGIDEVIALRNQEERIFRDKWGVYQPKGAGL